MGTGRFVIGLDVGTQSTKGLLVDGEASDARTAVVARATASYGLLEGLPAGAAEQHPATWVEAVREVIASLLASLDSPQNLRAIGVSGQQHGLVVLDEKDEVVRPAKLWCDTVSALEAEELSQRLGRRIPAGFTASKILWMRRYEPDLWARVRAVLLPHDYINFLFTGKKSMEAGDASGTGFFDPVTRQFDASAMRACAPELPLLVAEILEAGEPAGRVSAAGALLSGLPDGLLVASGGGDNMMSAFGSGATRPGIVVASLGTSGTVFAQSPRPVVDPEGLIAPFCDSTGGWLPLLCVMNATGIADEVRSAFDSDLEWLTVEATRVPAGASGLLCVPFLQGERVPDLPGATGAFLGLRPGTMRRGALFRAALEGVALNLGLGVDRMGELGLEVHALRLVGGGAKNPLWRQILSDVLGVEVRIPLDSESAALGAALQALWTARRQDGEDVSADEVAAPFIALAPLVIAPDAERVSIYREAKARFREVVSRLFGPSGPAPQ